MSTTELLNLACRQDRHHMCTHMVWDPVRDRSIDCACACHADPPDDEGVLAW